MSVLVTGANGFLGRNVVRALAEAGQDQIRCLVRPGSDASAIESIKGVSILRGTLTNPADCGRAVSEADEVYHLASGVAGAAADMFANSVVGTRNLLDAMAARKSPPRLIHCSSFGVYGVAALPGKAVVDEQTPLEPHPEKRDVYSHSKLRQEQLVWDYREKHGIPTVVLRPGVIYGPGGGAMSGRIGINLFGLFLFIGRGNLLPLSYVTNCADAFVSAGGGRAPDGETYNVVDGDIITAREFLRQYRRKVQRVPYIPVPWLVTKAATSVLERYVAYSKGQLPPVFTHYKVASVWKGQRFSNDKLVGLGWNQRVSTEDGLRAHFEHLAA